MSNRFDYVKYDDHAIDLQARFKAAFQQVEAVVVASLESAKALYALRDLLPSGRAADLAGEKISEFANTPYGHTSDLYQLLEESYMWVGKAIRDDQIRRNGTAQLQEGRGDE